MFMTFGDRLLVVRCRLCSRMNSSEIDEKASCIRVNVSGIPFESFGVMLS